MIGQGEQPIPEVPDRGVAGNRCFFLEIQLFSVIKNSSSVVLLESWYTSSELTSDRFITIEVTRLVQILTLCFVGQSCP
jgi:hypothetical protein